MSRLIHKSHNVSVLLHHVMFRAKYRRVMFDDLVESVTALTIAVVAQLRPLTTKLHSLKYPAARGGDSLFSHEGAKTEAQAQELYEEFLPELLGVLDELRLLSGVLLLRFKSMEGAAGRVRCESFRGESNTPKFERFQVPTAQFITLYNFWDAKHLLAQVGEKFWCVSPFLLPQSSDSGHSSHIQIFKGRKTPDGGVTEWEFETTGVSRSHKQPETDFSQDLADLLALLPLGGGTS